MLRDDLPTVADVEGNVPFGLGLEKGRLGGLVESSVGRAQQGRADTVSLSLGRDPEKPEVGVRPVHRMVLVHVRARRGQTPEPPEPRGVQESG